VIKAFRLHGSLPAPGLSRELKNGTKIGNFIGKRKKNKEYKNRSRQSPIRGLQNGTKIGNFYMIKNKEQGREK